MLENKITLDFFPNIFDYYHVYKINRSEAAELPHYHDFFQICYIAKGAIIHKAKDKEVVLFRGDSFVIPPSFSHSLISKSQDSEFYSLSFMEQLFDPGFSSSGVNKFLTALKLDTRGKDHLDIRLKLSLDETTQSNIIVLLDCLLSEFSLKIQKDLSMAASLISSILLLLARTYFAVPEMQRQLHKAEDSYYKPILSCKEYIDQNYREDISLSQLARKFAISRSELCLRFPKIVRKPLKRYLSEKRIEQAITLLKNENLSFQEISDLVGYEDYSTFFRNFHRVVGISPLQYRNGKLD